MVVQHYIYTRNNAQDYGDFLIPTCLNSEELFLVHRIIYPKLSEDNYNDYKGQWVLIFLQNCLVFGVICDNQRISEKYYADSIGRDIRGFFSVVIKDALPNDLKVPYDITYFKRLYKEYVETHWDSYDSYNCITEKFLKGRYNYISPSSTYAISSLNDKKEVVMFPNDYCDKELSHSLGFYISKPQDITVQSVITNPSDISATIGPDYVIKEMMRLRYENEALGFLLKKKQRLVWIQWLVIVVLLLFILKSVVWHDVENKESENIITLQVKDSILP